MFIFELLEKIHAGIEAVGIPDSRREAEFLVRHVLRKTSAQLLLSRACSVSALDQQRCEDGLKRRCAREPLAYVTGEQEFWSLPFKVSSDVLIPRPETELLIESALDRVRSTDKPFTGSVLDIGTGSGIIAVVLALELPKSTIYAVDYSPATLVIAKENAVFHGVSDRVHFIASDLTGGIDKHVSFPLVLTNPPYVVHGTLSGLQPEVYEHEPLLALDGGPDGLQIIYRIAEELDKILAPGGSFFMEIGFDQEELVRDIFSQFSFLEAMQVLPDYAGLPRIFQAKRIY